MTDTLDDFAADLAREDRADKTVENYLRDLCHFAHFFAQNDAGPFCPAAITPTDKDYRRYLMVQLHAKTALMNAVENCWGAGAHRVDVSWPPSRLGKRRDRTMLSCRKHLTGDWWPCDNVRSKSLQIREGMPDERTS